MDSIIYSKITFYIEI